MNLKQGDCVCRSYVQGEIGQIISSTAQYIGFKVVRPPNLQKEGRFRVVRMIPEGQDWHEENLSDSYYAFSLNLLPRSAWALREKYEAQLRSDGYFADPGEVLINAASGEFKVLKTLMPKEIQQDALSWMLIPPKLDTASLTRFVNAVFRVGGPSIDVEINSANLDGALSLFLMRTKSGFEIKVSTVPAENTINPSTLEGGGEILPEHGHKPLLMLVYLQKQFREHFPNEKKPFVIFGDAFGSTFTFDWFSALGGLIDKMGFDCEATKADAETLGLIPKLFSTSSSEFVEDLYF